MRRCRAVAELCLDYPSPCALTWFFIRFPGLLGSMRGGHRLKLWFAGPAVASGWMQPAPGTPVEQASVCRGTLIFPVFTYYRQSLLHGCHCHAAPPAAFPMPVDPACGCALHSLCCPSFDAFPLRFDPRWLRFWPRPLHFPMQVEGPRPFASGPVGREAWAQLRRPTMHVMLPLLRFEARLPCGRILIRFSWQRPDLPHWTSCSRQHQQKLPGQSLSGSFLVKA